MYIGLNRTRETYIYIYIYSPEVYIYVYIRGLYKYITTYLRVATSELQGHMIVPLLIILIATHYQPS